MGTQLNLHQQEKAKRIAGRKQEWLDEEEGVGKGAIIRDTLVWPDAFFHDLLLIMPLSARRDRGFHPKTCQLHL